MGKASLPKTPINDTLDANRDRKKQFGRERAAFSRVPLYSTSIGSGINSTSDSSITSVVGLSTAGGTMMGPIAFYPQSQTISNGTINVSSSNAYSSRVVVGGQGAASDDLEVILNASHAGQILFFQPVTVGHTITLQDYKKTATAWATSTSYSIGNVVLDGGLRYTCYTAHTSSSATDPGTGSTWATVWYRNNIHIPGATEKIIQANEIVLLQYDQSSTATWTLVSGGGASGADISLSNLNATGEAHFANPTLSNLGTTSVNANIIPQAGQLLGSDGNEWARVHSNSYRLGTAGTVSASSNDIIGNSSGIYFNVPSTKLFNFRVNNSSIGTISTSGTVTFPNFVISTSLNLNDATSYPGANGSIYREGNDVKIFTGGSEINMSTIGAAGANTALSNLATTTSINSNIIPQAGKLLGSSGNEWSRVHSNNYRLGTAGTSSASSNDITGTTSGITFNVATGDSFNFSVNNSSVATISTSGTATFPYTIINNSIIFNNSSSNPTTNGEFTRNGNDVKVYTGGAVKNLSDIGTGGGSSGANDTLSNLGSTAINAALIPASNLSANLGSSSKKFNVGYIYQIPSLHLLTMDGTVGANINMEGGILHFDVDNDTYIESGTDDQMQFFSGGSVRMKITNSNVLFNTDISMFSGMDVSLSGTGRIDLVSTGGSVTSFDGYVAIKVGGSTKYIQIYS